jgi:hypothetical protein
MAVAEFLENVDLAALGLAVVPRREEVGWRWVRGRVEQQVDAIAGSANKVLAGVMDTSFGMKSFLPGQEAQVSGVNSTVGSATVPAAAAVAATTTTTINATTGKRTLEPR